ncbi:MAG: serine/threonine-protein kinase [Planctomycetota bacterium]
MSAPAASGPAELLQRLLDKARITAEDQAALQAGGLALGPYRVEGRLGRGGMGAVLAAKDTRLGRDVALKVIPPDADPQVRGRFQREAQAMALLDHPHVVRVFALEEVDGLSFLVLERVQGISLQRRLLREGALPQHEAWRLLRHVTRALAAAEAAGVLHRDIKPGNVLWVPDAQTYKVCDFGLARLQGAQSDLTVEGTTMGTPFYMSPEQVRGQELDGRSDMYSLGMSLFEALTGRVPFSDGPVGAVLVRRLEADVPDLRQVAPAVAPALAAVVARLCARERDERFASWAELDRLLDQQSEVGASPPRPALSDAQREQLDTAALEGGAIPLPDAATAFVPPPGGALPTATRPPSDEPPEATWREPEIGEVLGNYQLERVLGRGGMGVIYLARKTPGEERFAVKAQLVGQGEDGERRRERFKQEVQALRRLAHPNVVRVHAYGRKGPFDWYAMDYVEGDDLKHVLSEGTLTLADKLTLFVNVCKAMEHAHERGIAHRDLKPANVLVDAQKQPHVLDFGLAKVLDGGSGLTRTGAFLGTPHYMAPEQFLNPKDADHRTDVFALGVILFELLTGQRPFEGDTAGEVSYKIMRERPPRPSKLSPHLDPAVDEVVLKALERDPERRYPDVRELKKAVIRYRRGTAQRAGLGARIGEALARWYAEHKVGFLVGLLVGLLLYTPLVVALYYLLGG